MRVPRSARRAPRLGDPTRHLLPAGNVRRATVQDPSALAPAALSPRAAPAPARARADAARCRARGGAPSAHAARLERRIDADEEQLTLPDLRAPRALDAGSGVCAPCAARAGSRGGARQAGRGRRAVVSSEDVKETFFPRSSATSSAMPGSKTGRGPACRARRSLTRRAAAAWAGSARTAPQPKTPTHLPRADDRRVVVEQGELDVGHPAKGKDWTAWIRDEQHVPTVRSWGSTHLLASASIVHTPT